MTSSAVDRPAVLGMVGSGQLARMTHQATVGMAWPFRLFAEHPEESAAGIHADVTVGSIDSFQDLDAFADGCDVVTFDHELVDPTILADLEDRGHVLRPSATALRHAQDKLHQRQRLSAAGFPVPAFAAAGTPADLVHFGDEHGWPVVAKAVRGGYDGRGVWVVEDADAARSLWDDARGHGTDLLVEELVPIERELAVAVARRPSGASVTYPTTETVQRDGILVELLVPAAVDAAVRDQAQELGARIVEAVDATGLVAIELFHTADGLLVNELAMRPHNSMHWTIEGARTSQFQNHARAALDLPLGTTTTTAPCVATVNVLGPDDGSDPRHRLAAALTIPDVGVHLYDKDPRPGRKLGHVTAVGDDPDDTRARARRAAAALTGAPVEQGDDT